MSDYNKRLVEVDEVLKYLSKENLEKIPLEIRQAIKKEKDENYIWKYDETKNLSEQNLNRKTIVMLSYLNMEYLLNKEQKEYLQQLHEFNEIKNEIKKRESYNPNEIFKNDIQKQEEQEIVKLKEIKKNKWYEKIICFIKTICKIGENR